jgi:hypothetical protein
MKSEKQRQSESIPEGFPEMARTHCTPNASLVPVKINAGVGHVIVFGHENCALNLATTCIKSPQSDWPLCNLPSQHQKETPPDKNSGQKPAEMLAGCKTVQNTSLITTRAKRRVDCQPRSTSPKDRSQEDTIWAAMKKSTSSGESSGVLAGAFRRKLMAKLREPGIRPGVTRGTERSRCSTQPLPQKVIKRKPSKI